MHLLGNLRNGMNTDKTHMQTVLLMFLMVITVGTMTLLSNTTNEDQFNGASVAMSVAEQQD